MTASISHYRWFSPIIPALRRQRLVGLYEFESSPVDRVITRPVQSYIVRPVSKVKSMSENSFEMLQFYFATDHNYRMHLMQEHLVRAGEMAQ